MFSVDGAYVMSMFLNSNTVVCLFYTTVASVKHLVRSFTLFLRGVLTDLVANKTKDTFCVTRGSFSTSVNFPTVRTVGAGIVNVVRDAFIVPIK